MTDPKEPGSELSDHTLPDKKKSALGISSGGSMGNQGGSDTYEYDFRTARDTRPTSGSGIDNASVESSDLQTNRRPLDVKMPRYTEDTNDPQISSDGSAADAADTKSDESATETKSLSGRPARTSKLSQKLTYTSLPVGGYRTPLEGELKKFKTGTNSNSRSVNSDGPGHKRTKPDKKDRKIQEWGSGSTTQRTNHQSMMQLQPSSMGPPSRPHRAAPPPDSYGPRDPSRSRQAQGVSGESMKDSRQGSMRAFTSSWPMSSHAEPGRGIQHQGNFVPNQAPRSDYGYSLGGIRQTESFNPSMAYPEYSLHSVQYPGTMQSVCDHDRAPVYRSRPQVSIAPHPRHAQREHTAATADLSQPDQEEAAESWVTELVRSP